MTMRTQSRSARTFPSPAFVLYGELGASRFEIERSSLYFHIPALELPSAALIL
jgi:hypothetical protein